MPALPSNSFPSSFRVHESTSSSSTPSSTSRQTLDSTSFASLQSTMTTRALSSLTSLKQKLEQIELLSSPSCTTSDLRTAGPILDSSSWTDCLEERHMEGVCPYPTCPNPPSTAYDPEAREEAVRFKLRGKALLEGGSAPEEDKGAFCSKRCRARAEWYKINCVGKQGWTELLEDVEERRRAVARSVKEIKVEGPISEATAAPGVDDRLRPDDSQKTTKLLETLQIRERPPSKDQAPSAPSFDAPDFEGASAASAPNPHSHSRTTPTTLKPARSTPLAISSSIPSLRPLASPAPSPSSLARSAPPPIRSPDQPLDSAPMPIFTSHPIMLEGGREVEWDVDFVREEGAGEEEREAWAWLEEARREAEREVAQS